MTHSDNPIKRYSQAHPENVVWTPETGWTDECMEKQKQEIAKCGRCGKTLGRGHCRECWTCTTHEPWCSRSQ